MIYIENIVYEHDGQTASLKSIQTENLDEALDQLYDRIVSATRATIKS